MKMIFDLSLYAPDRKEIIDILCVREDHKKPSRSATLPARLRKRSIGSKPLRKISSLK